MKNCEHCGKEFVPGKFNPKQRFCGEPCQREWWRLNPNAGKRPEYICGCCGKSYRAKKKDRDKFCSRECAWIGIRGRDARGIEPVFVRVCEICGSHSKHSVCSDECDAIRERRRTRKYEIAKKLLRPRPCKECGVVFTPEYGNKRRQLCSAECARKNGYKSRQRITGKWNHIQGKRLRAFYGESWQEHYERIDRRNVFTRDNWKCQICGRKIRISRKWAVDQATIDHIVPMSIGGDHKYTNVQSACMKCNSRKRDIGGGQLRLF